MAGNIVNIIVWWVVLDLLALASLPIVLLAFRNLPDRGYSTSRVVGILLVSYLSWILSHVLQYTWAVILLSVFIVTFASIVIVVKSGINPLRNLDASVVLRTEVVFAVCFLMFVIIRMYTPDINGAEKLMDFAFINAILRSGTMPPFDPWFAGETMNYYYFGYFIIATLIKLSGISSNIAYNLTVASFFALAATTSYGIGYNLTKSARCGILSAFFVCVIGNFIGFKQFIEAFLYGGVLDAAYYWAGSRVIPNTINEFPFFSFLHADMHAHVVSILLELVLIMLALSILVNLGRHVFSLEDGGENIVRFALTALFLGALIPTNTWDFPTYFILVVASMVLGIGHRLPSSVSRISEFAKQLIPYVLLLLLVSLVLYLPYNLGAGSYSERGMAIVSERTYLHHYLAIYGMFLFIISSYVCGRSVFTYFANAPHLQGPLLGGSPVFTRIRGFFNKRTYSMAAVIVLIVILIFAVYTGVALIVLLALLIILAAVKLLDLRTFGDDVLSEQFILVLILLGCAISLFCELFYIKDGMPMPYDRMNTIFKLYIHVWLFFSIASALIMHKFLNALQTQGVQIPDGTGRIFRGICEDTQNIRFHRYVWLAVACMLIAACSFYPVTAVYTRTGAFGGAPDLDGTAYIKRLSEDDYHMISWINENIAGHPVILERLGADFEWSSIISANTGLPTVMGWPGHEVHWRQDQNKVSARMVDSEKIYSTADTGTALELLRKYNVSYVYVGSLEIARYGVGGGLGKFYNGSYFNLVYRNHSAALYEVT